MNTRSFDFDGSTYEPQRDGHRLRGQLHAVKTLMSDGRWRTITEISCSVGGSEAGVSARLRDLRKPKFGGYVVERRHVRGGLFGYRLVLSPAGELLQVAS